MGEKPQFLEPHPVVLALIETMMNLSDVKG